MRHEPAPVTAVSRDLGPGLDPAAALLALRDEPGLVCLWGAWAGGGAVLASRPTQVAPEERDPFAALDRLPRVTATEGAPVVGGGWLGWLGYDLRTAVEHVPTRHPAAGVPARRLAYYDHLLRYDEATARWHFEALVGEGRAGQLHERARSLAAVITGARPTGRPYAAGAFTGPPASSHLRSVEQAIGRVRAGELFQVNVCTRLAAPFTGSAVDVFATAAARLRPAYAAYVAGETATLVGLSPELFLRRAGDAVRAAPIKGTRRRSGGADAAEADALRHSGKDAAENIMIVDLMRNDLGRVCVTGSVAAARLLDVEAHAGVWHLVSTVTGTLPPGTGNRELLRATFPPGSVTGAPKVAAMQTIDVVEAHSRGAYTGAVGYSSPLAGLELAVTIRTFEVAGGRIELGVGGGITVDSTPAEEWREAAVKAAPLLAAAGFPAWSAAAPGVAAVGSPYPSPVGGPALLETIATRGGAPVRLADHLARLDRSSREVLGMPAPDLADRVAWAARTGNAVRVVLTAAGATVQAAALTPRTGELHLVTVPRPAGLWRHKWADRRWTQAAPDGLFVAADGCLLETTTANLVLVAPDGSLVTAPLRDDLLPGVTRRAVLDAAAALGVAVDLRAPLAADLRVMGAFATSSVSGLVPVATVDGVPLPRCDPALLAALLAALRSPDTSSADAGPAGEVLPALPGAASPLRGGPIRPRWVTGSDPWQP